MATTISDATLTVKLTETVTLNGIEQGGTNTLTIASGAIIENSATVTSPGVGGTLHAGTTGLSGGSAGSVGGGTDGGNGGHGGADDGEPRLRRPGVHPHHARQDPDHPGLDRGGRLRRGHRGRRWRQGGLDHRPVL